MRLRTILIILMVLVLFVTFVGTSLVGQVIETIRPEPVYLDGPNPHVTQALQRQVEEQWSQWFNSEWQEQTRERLDQHGVTVQIHDHMDRLIFSNWAGYTGQIRHVAIIENGEHVGSVRWGLKLETPKAKLDRFLDSVTPFVLITVYALAFSFGIWLISRAILKPLSELSEAAQAVGANRLDFIVPTFHIRELNEYAAAFDQMRIRLSESIMRESVMEQQRREFVAAVAHDLRTPLSSVRGYLEGMQDGVADTPAKQQRYLHVALAKTALLERLIDGFFLYSKTELLEQPPHLEKIDLRQLAQHCLDGVSLVAASQEVSLRLSDAPLAIVADRMMLARVLDNLVENALHHTPPGGVVEIGWVHRADSADVWVQDSGPGIPEHALPHIFSLGYRSDKARSTRKGGAGLGLAIAQRLVKLHGGAIEVANQGGARFTIRLPRHEPD